MFRQLAAREGASEETRGDTDLMSFYNLFRLYDHMTRTQQNSNFHKQLSGTGFSGNLWYGGEDCSLSPLAAHKYSNASDNAFRLLSVEHIKWQPGKVELSEAEKGPLLDISALGDPQPSQPLEVKKRRRESTEREEEAKLKRSKKEKKAKRSKSEKRKPSPGQPSEDRKS